MIGLLIWVLCVLLIAGAFLALVRAIINTAGFAPYARWGGVLYAFVVLIVVLICISAIYGGPNSVVSWARPPKF
jgi:hypothetical protein